jgi:hypothetical protein
MIYKIKICAAVIALVTIGTWGTFSVYKFFTHKTPPKISFTKIKSQGYYNKILKFSINSANDYSIYELNFWLDNKEISLGNSKWVKAKQFELPISIDTTNLTNGAHVLKVEAIDSSYNRNRSHKKITFNVDNLPLRASFITNDFTIDQGKTLHLKIQTNKKISQAQINFLNNNYLCVQTPTNETIYECFIPIDCDQKPEEISLTTKLNDFVNNTLLLTNTVKIHEFNFITRKGNYDKAEQKLAQEQEIGASSNILQEALNKWVQESPHKKLWTGLFDIPIEAKIISKTFGALRTISSRGRYRHNGVDIINKPRCMVYASQNGKVIIKDRFVYTGNTLVIDHGLGVFTLYGHLEEFADINVGEFITKGKPIGKVGMTGYATGYHLHWELRINNTPVDPLEWTEKIC